MASPSIAALGSVVGEAFPVAMPRRPEMAANVMRKNIAQDLMQSKA
jgi:hypothetical protein